MGVSQETAKVSLIHITGYQASNTFVAFFWLERDESWLLENVLFTFLLFLLFSVCRNGAAKKSPFRFV